MKLYMNFYCGLLVILSSQVLFSDGLNRIPNHELHKAMATDRQEMIRLFGEDSAETVPDYKIAVVRPHRTKRSIGDNRKDYKLSMYGEDLHLELEPNDEVVSQSLVVMKKLPGERWTQELYTPEGRFLQGHVVSDPNSHVAVRELKTDKEISGSIYSDGYLYRIHPVTKKAKKVLALKGHGHHVITKRSMKDPKTGFLNPEFFPEPVRVNDQHEDSVVSQSQRTRSRKRRELGPKYIEAMMTMDKVSCDHYGQVTMDFILAIANMVSRLYKDKSMELDVRFTLTKVILLKAFEAGMDVQQNQIDSAVKYMKVFAAWSQSKNSPAGQAGHFDNGVLLSRDICGLKDCVLGGVGYIGVPCSLSLGYTVNMAVGLDAAFYVAHEMGHNFGIPHDSGSCSKGYIMAPGQGSGPNAFKWSKCSSDKLKSIFGRVKCYDNKPPSTNIAVPKLPPGYTFNGDKQCKFINGPQYRLCPLTLSNCALLFCYKSGGCSSLGTPPIDGSPCGIRKWCVGGECVGVGTSLPPAIDGGWGAWGAYGGCSRTCGGGVRYRTRSCNNPSPQHDGKPCPGSSIGEFEICAKQPCASNMNYRLEQCKKIKSEYTNYAIRGNPCYLWCLIGHKGYGEGTVADGTRYSSDPLNHDICIQGKYVSAGCDNVINSGSDYDRCMKCLGDGRACVPVTGVYDKNHLAPGIKNADPMFVIPVGATYFRIKERSPTKSVLNIKLDPANSNSFIFPQRPLNSNRAAAGTTIKYITSNTELNYAEAMEFVGPTNKALVPMFVNTLSQKNVGYDYFYYKPGQGSAPSNYIWKYKVTGSCSATCAGGVQAQVISCHRGDDETKVSKKYCDLGNKPDEMVPCNTQPCPAKWEPEIWQPCSKRCGGGNRTRLVPCVQQVTSEIYRNVEYYYCNISARPPLSGPCNEVDCGAAWVASEWSECVIGKTGGIAKREINCQNKLANGTVIPLNRTHCNAITDMIPEEIMNCTVRANSNNVQPWTLGNLVILFLIPLVFGSLG